MKKTLSLLLVLAMVLSSFGFAFAAEDEVNPAEFLNEKGILKGNASGDLMLEENLKRQDMVVMLSRLLGEEDEAKAFEGETSFTDIADKFYVPYIAWAEAKELTEGVGDNKFGFDRAVKENEVVAFMLRALGYTDVKWEDVPAKAVELGLVEKDADLTVDAKREVLANLTYKALGMKMKDSEKTLAEHLEIEMPVPEVLEVEEVVADNLKEIKVVFNKAVDESVYDADNYEIANQEIADITYVEEDNTAILLLDGQLKNKKEYTLKIDGVKDDKNTLKVEEKFTAFDNEIPAVEEVIGLGTKAIKVVMSEPVKKPATSNFKLDGKTVYGTVDVAGREVIISLYKTNDVGEHELTVRGLEDYAEYKSLEGKYGFEVVEDKDKPVVEEVSATLEKVVVTFSEDINPLTVSNKTVYYKDGGSKVYPEGYARVAGNKYVFVFGGKKALPVYETTLYIEGAEDYSGNKMDPAEEKIKASIDETRPEVLKAELQDDLRTIVVKFNKSVNEEDAKDISNYRVLDAKDNKQTISKVIKEDSRTYKVVLGKALSENKEYTLKISGIKDNNKYANVMIAYETTITVGDYTAPSVAAVSGKYESVTVDGKNLQKTIVHVFFDKEMDLASLSNPNNYLVEIGGVNKLLSDVDGETDIVKSDGKVVILTVINKSKVTKVGVLGVEDTTGKNLKNYGKMFDVVIEKLELKNAEATAKDTIVLTFNMPIDKIEDGAFKIEDTKEGRENKVAIKDIEIDGKEVTLTVDKLTADAYNYKLEVVKDKVYAYNGETVEKTWNELDDQIAPSMEKVVATHDSTVYDEGEEAYITKAELVVTFDEKVTKPGDLSDFVIKTVEEGKTAKLEGDITQTIDNTLTFTVKVVGVKKDTAFDVKTKSEVRYVLDDKENPANEMEKRSNVINGIEAQVAVDAEAAKITDELTFKVAETDKEDETKVTAAAVKAAQKLVADGYTVTAEDGTISETNKLTVTFVVTKNDTTIKAETSELTLTFTVQE